MRSRMDDSDESDSDVEISRKRKLNTLEDKETDESDDDEESESDDETDDSEDNGDVDITLTDDVVADQCAVCLMDFTDQELGVPNNCSHIFCLSCIQEWAKNINTCPVDRKVFHTIAVKKTKSGITITEIKVEDRTQVKVEYEDPTTCEVCGIGDREDRMLLCDGCDRGFHLECLSPPLYSVPEEEWYCRDCFIDNTQDNTQSQDNSTQECDTIDYSQHAIAFSDDEIPTFDLQSIPEPSGIARLDTRTSTSQQRRARTVATSRRRTQTGRTTQARTTQGRRTTQTSRTTRASRQSRGGQRSLKKKTTKNKSMSSDKGVSTITASTSKSKKKKRKKRKKSAKKNRNRNHENMPQNTTRYLLPNEMDAQATFSLFGSDFDLEYLPIFEPPACAVRSRQSSSPRLSTTANPDVLGSIFSGLNTLHSDSLSVDKQGKIISEEKKTATPPVKEPTGVRSFTQNISTEDKEKTLGSGNSHACSSKGNFKRLSIYENQDQRSKDPTAEKCRESANDSRDHKRLKRFQANTSTCNFTKPEIDYDSFKKNTNISSRIDLENAGKQESRDDKITPSASRLSLSSYKIPKKSPLNPRSKIESSEAVNFEYNSKSKLPIITTEGKNVRRKLAILGDPKERSGILHLLPPEVGRSAPIALDDRFRSDESISKNLCTSISQRRTDVDLGYSRKETVGKVSVSKSTSNLTSVPNVNKPGTSQDLTCGSLSHQPKHVEPPRPVAVVRPTKIDKNVPATSHEAEADKRRKKGIERLQRKQAICDEVKNALKPFYKHKEISKEDYKYIYSRAAEKISKSCFPIFSSGVVALVRDYVKKIKGRQIQSSKSETWA